MSRNPDFENGTFPKNSDLHVKFAIEMKFKNAKTIEGILWICDSLYVSDMKKYVSE